MNSEYVSGSGELARRPGNLVAILQKVQRTHGYLPAEELKTVARRTGRPLADVFSVATFYGSFSLKPRGRRLCSVCQGTACHVRGGSVVAEELARRLGVRTGETTADGEFTLEGVNCPGTCARGPVVVIDGRCFSDVGPLSVKGIVDRARNGLDVKNDYRLIPIEASCPHCNHSLMDPGREIDGRPSIRIAASFERERFTLRLSSLYGSRKIQSGKEAPLDAVLDLFCPHCSERLVGTDLCTDCAAPVATMNVRDCGAVQVCSRRGCTGRFLDIGGLTF